MRKIVSIVSLLLIVCFINISAQEKLFTIENCVFGWKLAPQRLNQLKWIGNTDKYCLIQNDELVSGEFNSQKKKTILSISDINKNIESFGCEKIQVLPSITWISDTRFIFKDENKLFAYDIKSKKLTKLNSYPEYADNISIDKNNFFCK